jgi:hypothetical protein
MDTQKIAQFALNSRGVPVFSLQGDQSEVEESHRFWVSKKTYPPIDAPDSRATPAPCKKLFPPANFLRAAA